MNRNLVKRNLRMAIFIAGIGIAAFFAAFAVTLAWVG
jgi:hypothetical protein